MRSASRDHDHRPWISRQYSALFSSLSWFCSLHAAESRWTLAKRYRWFEQAYTDAYQPGDWP